MIVLDARVLVALTDETNPSHAAARRILSSADTFAMTALSGVDLMAYPMPTTAGTWADLLRDFAVEVVPIEAADMGAIAATKRQSGLPMPDALTLWLARQRGAAVATFDAPLAAMAKQYGLAVHS